MKKKGAPGVRYCRACKKNTHWKYDRAAVNQWRVHGDFVGDYSGHDISKAQRGQTISRTGPAKLVSVIKCTECGRSVTP